MRMSGVTVPSFPLRASMASSRALRTSPRHSNTVETLLGTKNIFALKFFLNSWANIIVASTLSLFNS